MPKELISTTSATYRRRLSKAIRESLRNGVYSRCAGTVSRVEDVKFSDGHLKVRVSASNSSIWYPVADYDLDGFRDGYGRPIVASRNP